jgi:hypothetical protein
MSYSTGPVLFDSSNMSAFGTLEVGELTPVIQGDFVYGINTQLGVTTSANSATIDTNAGRLRLQSGTNSAGSATFNSRKIARYRAGQGLTARFTAVFSTPAASSLQVVGAGTTGDGYFFGYNGTAFGISRRSGGADNWTAQTAWNVDKCDGTGGSSFTWNKQLGNVMMIKYPYLGYGDIQFYVQNPVTGRWILCHVIQYANSSASVQIANPSLFFFADVTNAGNTTNLILYCGSYGIFLNGHREFVACPRWATDNNKATITAETNIFSLRNATTYNGVVNRGMLRLQSVSLGSDTTGQVITMRIRLAATVGGAPSFAPISGTSADGGITITAGNSVASIDTAGTTATAGTMIYNITAGSPCNQIVDLTPFDLFVAPGEIITFSGVATAASRISVAVNWAEDI